MGVVPAEYRGQARRFRAEMLERDLAYDRVVNAIIAPLKRRLRSKPTLRPASIIDTVRAWRQLPHQQYRLRPVQVLHDREDEFELCERRVAAGRLVNPAWEDNGELGLVIATVRLRVSDGILSKTLESSTIVSSHALARRFERSRASQRSAEAILDDIESLVDVQENTRGWRGVGVTANDYGHPREMRDIRTWWWWPD